MDLNEWVANHPDYAYVKELVAAGRLREAQQVEVAIILQWTERDSSHNKEMRVLAQSYDWLLFLTDLALAEFIEDVLQGHRAEFGAIREAFTESFGRVGGTTKFTKVTIGAEADVELTRYFHEEQPWARWFNVVAPDMPIEKLRDDLLRLREVHGDGWSEQ